MRLAVEETTYPRPPSDPHRRFRDLAATTSLALGEYPAGRHSPPRATRLRRWIFLAIKFPLLILIVFCGSLDLASIASTQIQPHGLLVGYVLAFRWALMDQRKRSPVCLRDCRIP